MTGSAFRVTPIPADVLDRIRAAGHDDFGNPLVPATDEDGGSPMRCCLRRSAPGDRLCVIAYRPFTDPTIEFIHTRNVYAGCFMFRISRP
jgi:hypothetical protein